LKDESEHIGFGLLKIFNQLRAFLIPQISAHRSSELFDALGVSMTTIYIHDWKGPYTGSGLNNNFIFMNGHD